MSQEAAERDDCDLSRAIMWSMGCDCQEHLGPNDYFMFMIPQPNDDVIVNFSGQGRHESRQESGASADADGGTSSSAVSGDQLPVVAPAGLVNLKNSLLSTERTAQQQSGATTADASSVVPWSSGKGRACCIGSGGGGPEGQHSAATFHAE